MRAVIVADRQVGLANGVNIATVKPTTTVQILAGMLGLTSLFKVPGMSLIPVGVVLAVFLLPVTISTLRPHKLFCKILIAAVSTSVAFGWVGGMLASAIRHQAPDPRAFIEINFWLLGHLALILGVSWAMGTIGLVPTVFLASCGGVVSVLLTGQGGSWKGQLGYVIVLLLLALATKLRPVAGRWVLVGGIILGAAFDARNQALVAFAALAVTFMSPTFARRVHEIPVRVSLRLAAVLIAIATVFITGMSAGWFGNQIQSRSRTQVAAAGNALEGGRTEWAATLDLFAHQPWGFGAAVRPSDTLERSAIAASGRAGGDTLGPYFEQSVFGARVDLHSITANLWFHFGIFGFALAVLFLVASLYSLTLVIADNRMKGLVAFCILSGVWDLLFSPSANADRLILGAASAILVASRATRSAAITTDTG